jgi:hypothetical protein
LELVDMKTIIEMAFEAGFVEYELEDYTQSGYDIRYERFAALVRADEREACAKVCENIYEGDEACGDWPSPEQCAEAIRARGNT